MHPKIIERTTEWIDSRRTRTLYAWLFLLVLVVIAGLNTHGSYAGSGDEPHYAMIAHSLVFDGDLDLANDYDERTNLVGGGSLAPGLHALPGKDGRLRPVHDVGLPLLFAPWFRLAYAVAVRSPQWLPHPLMARMRLNPPLILRHLLSLAMISVTAVMAVLMFRASRNHGSDQSHSVRPLLATLLLVLSPPLLSHSFLFFTEIPTALLATVFWLELRRDEGGVPLRALLLGTVAGLLLLLHVRNIGLVAGLSALYCPRLARSERRWRTVLAFSAPLAALIVVRTVLNYSFWGTFVTSPHASPVGTQGLTSITTEAATRLFGLLLDIDHGLLTFAPVYLLALPGMLLLRRTDRRTFRSALVIVVAYLLPVLLPFVNRHGWDGGWSPAARFLVPITPILVVASVRFVSELPRIPVAVGLLLGVQALLDVLYWQHPKLLWSAGAGESKLVAYLSPGWAHIDAWLPCWHLPSMYTVVVSLVAIAAWIAVSWRFDRRLLTASPAGRGETASA